MKLKAALVGLCMAWASSAAGLLLQIPDGQSGCPTSPAGWNFTSCSGKVSLHLFDTHASNTHLTKLPFSASSCQSH